MKNDVLLARAIFPCDESKLHDLASKFCRCNVRAGQDPSMPGWTVYIHQSFDRREVDEYFAARRPRRDTPPL